MTAPRERSLIFSGWKVRHILSLPEGAVFQTRRVVKLPAAPEHLGKWEATTVGGDGVRFTDGSQAPEMVALWHTRTGKCIAEPHQPGDRVWVRETFGCVCCQSFGPDRGPRREPDEEGPCDLVYEADDVDCSSGWRSGRFMWREASRIQLEVVETRVQRLQEISEEDAKAEGMQFHDGLGIGHSGWRHDANHHSVSGTAREAFAVAWEAINGKRSPWSSSPWVWAYSLRKLAP